MAIELLCRKLGMTRIFTEKGEAIPVTVLEAGPNFVVQKKTEETDGYSALQLGFGEQRRKTHLEGRCSVTSRRQRSRRSGTCTSRGSAPRTPQPTKPGQEVKVDIFTQGQRVDVIGT